MYRSILVPLDGSPVSEYALPIACDLARRSGALVRLVHVHEAYTDAPIYVQGLPVIDEHMHGLVKVHEQAYLERIRGWLVDMSDLQITTDVLEPASNDLRDQSVAQVLANYAATTNTDLIVMTSHGRSGLARFWLGSVADTLVRISALPLLLLRPNEQKPLAEHPLEFRQILIALDGSPLAEQVLQPARAIGGAQTEFTLLHVVEPHLLVRSRLLITSVDADAHDTQQRQMNAQHYIERIASTFQADGIAVHQDVRVAEQVAAAILDAATERRADLIAIATHGRSGLARLLLGSVADKVVRAARLPVLVYRPQLAHAEDSHTA